MVNTFRRFSKPLMLVITVIVVVVFVAWSPNLTHSTSSLPWATIYGRSISVEEASRIQRKFEVYARLQTSYAQLLGIGATESLAVARSIVFENEADNLGISATEEQKLGMMRQIPAFGGVANEEELRKILQNLLNPFGFSNDALVDFLNGEARMQRMRQLIGSIVEVTPDELSAGLRQQFMRTEVSYVQLAPSEFSEGLAVTEEELKKDYEERKGQFMTPPERKVRYAAFLIPPPPEGKPYVESDRKALLQTVAYKAYDFRQALNEPNADFEALAKQYGGIVKTTAEFFNQDNPPNELEQNPEVAAAAFALTKEAPYSKELTQTQNLEKGAYVLAYGEEKAPEQLSLDSVKEKIKTDLTADKAGKLLQEKAKELRAKLAEEKAAGKTFYEAAEALGRKPVPFPTFGGSQRPPQQNMVSVFLVPAAEQLAPGELSEPLPVLDGTTIIAHLDQRTVDEPTPEQRESFRKYLQFNKENLAFYEWLQGRTRAAGVVDAKFR